VIRDLNSSLGPPTRNKGGEVEYTASTPHWTVTTSIDFGHTWGSMISYSHVLVPNGDRPLQPDLHICGWMGLAGQTTWELYTGNDTAEVAEGIVTLIVWFLGRWQELIPLSSSFL